VREIRKAHKAFVGNSEGKAPLGRTMLRWENNIKVDLKELGHESVKWIRLAQG
jgi:hypothetical protein